MLGIMYSVCTNYHVFEGEERNMISEHLCILFYTHIPYKLVHRHFSESAPLICVYAYAHMHVHTHTNSLTVHFVLNITV